MSTAYICASLKMHRPRVETEFLFNRGQLMHNSNAIVRALLKAVPLLNKTAQMPLPNRRMTLHSHLWTEILPNAILVPPQHECNLN